MEDETVYYCDRRYLLVSLLTHLSIIIVISAFVGLQSVALALIIGCILAVLAFARWWIRRKYRFTVTRDSIRTEKLFSKDIDVTTPIRKISSISAYDGIFEAILGVGTLRISTASSYGDHADFEWPNLSSHRKLAERLKAEADAGRGSQATNRDS